MTLPYLRLLEDAEAVGRARHSGASFLAGSPRGERWLCFALGKKRVPVRIHASAADETPVPRPLLILLHGAGGSENMFFDVYGAGTYVNRARELAWIVAAPNNAGDAAAALVDALGGGGSVPRASATVTWQDYADTEHLTVVQRAAGDVFAWFESSGVKK